MHFGLLLQSVICSFLGIESEFMHIQGFLQLSDSVGMFYSKNKSVPSICHHRLLGKLGCRKLHTDTVAIYVT